MYYACIIYFLFILAKTQNGNAVLLKSANLRVFCSKLLFDLFFKKMVFSELALVFCENLNLIIMTP